MADDSDLFSGAFVKLIVPNLNNKIVDKSYFVLNLRISS